MIDHGLKVVARATLATQSVAVDVKVSKGDVAQVAATSSRDRCFH